MKSQDISLSKKAMPIFKHYQSPNSKTTNDIFPILNEKYDLANEQVLINQISSKTTVINKTLKQVALGLNISIPLTTHVARHTFSDLIRQKGVSVYDISQLLKHSDLKTTQHYLASIDQVSADNVLKML